MTIPATASQVAYDGDGTSTAFPIPFVFDTAADLKVILTDEDGTPTEITTGFSITGGSGSTGTLTMDTAPAVDETLTILDDPELTQPTDYTDNDAFAAETHEGALDRLCRQVKRLHQRVDRSIRMRDGDVADGDDNLLPLESARAGKFLAFDASGNPVASEGTGGGDSALRTDLASTAASSDGARLVGFRREETGSVAHSVQDVLARTIWIEDFGAVGDDSTDCTAAIQACIELAETTGARIRMKGGIYRISDTLVFSAEGAVDFGGSGSVEHYGSVDPQYFQQTTVIRKTGNFTGIEVGTADPAIAPAPYLHNFTLDATSDDTAGIGIDVIRTRGNFTIRQVCVQDQGGHGVVLRHGNLGTYQDLKCMLNGGDGMLVTGATPVPDTNACVFINCDLRGNTGWGLNLDVAWANFGIGITAQSNVAGGVRLNNARQNYLQIYSEANTGPEVEFVDTADCKGNFVVIVEGFATFNGTTANRNTVLNMKRGAEFDPNYNKLTANKFVLPNLQNDNTGASPTTVAGVLEITHTADRVYEHKHSGSDADARTTFTHENPSFKHRIDADAILLRKAASSAGSGEVSLGSSVQTTVGAAGAASALPANPTGYLVINVAGTNRVIPYYAAS